MTKKKDELKEISLKANEDVLNSLHFMVADKIARLLKEAEGEPELMIKVLREARSFLKENNVTADVTANVPLRQVEQSVVVAELPFEVEED